MGVRGVNRLPTAQDHLAQASWAHAAGNQAARSGMHDAATKWYQQAADHRALAAKESQGHPGGHADSVQQGSNSTGNHFNPDQKRDDHGRFD